MGEVEYRKVQTIENTLYSNLPAEYAKKLGIESGDAVSIRLDEKKQTITIRKLHDEEGG